jgi:release factor glutamine methyltransferase
VTTVKAALSATTARLAGLTPCDNPQLDSRLLLQHVSGLSHTQLITRDDTLLSDEQSVELESLLTRRETGEPVAYLLGEWGFYDLQLQVNRHVLVPRPETEQLVEWVFSTISQVTKPQICDLGTGTGAIAIAIGKHRPDSTVTAVDNCPLALAVAMENSARNGTNNVSVKLSSWLASVEDTFDCIVSNPPYIGADEPELALLQHEPQQALVAGNSGLADIEEIIEQATQKLTPNGWLFFEHGHLQAEPVAELLQRHGYSNIQHRADLSQTVRFTSAQLS